MFQKWCPVSGGYYMSAAVPDIKYHRAEIEVEIQRTLNFRDLLRIF